jgi:PAS domain S-box-containing protein
MAPLAAPIFWKNVFERFLKSAAIAIAFVLAALLGTFPLQRVIAYPFVFLFFGAIVGSAWVGGTAAGIYAVLLSSLVVNYFFIPPTFSISVAKEAQSYLAAFILCAIVVSIVSSARKRAERAVREANDRLEFMVQKRTAELERSNHEILERERHLRELTEAIPQQIWRAKPDGQIEYLNHHLRRYLGENSHYPEAGFFEKILHPDDQPLFNSALAAALAHEERFEVEARILGTDNQYRWFLVRGNPQRTSNGKIECWYGIHIDIEEQRRAQQGLVAAQDELSRLSKHLTMTEMAASIAHELNQPLTAVVTQAYACREWLRGESLNLTKATATADKIIKESTRASDVVRRVRSLFQKESPTCQSADVNQLIVDLSRILREEAIRRNVSIRLELADSLPAIDMDSVLIQQVLLNLATNGMEAMSQTTQERELLICSAKGEHGEITISVQDRGPGVPANLTTQIFEPFFSTKPDGIGMGLAICRSIIEAHGGRLVVFNLPSGGAKFQFNLRATL